MSPTSKNGYPWSQEDLRQLRQLAAAGMTAAEVADALNRTKIGVKSKALSLGIALKPSRPQGAARSGRAPSGRNTSAASGISKR